MTNANGLIACAFITLVYVFIDGLVPDFINVEMLISLPAW